jgi:hypothetical protein
MLMRLLPVKKAARQEADDDAVCFHDTVHPHAESILESLYQSYMCSLTRMQQYYPLESAKSYMAYEDKQVSAFFVFQIQGDTISVLNEQIPIGSKELMRFVGHAFSRYARVSKICFYAIDTSIAELPCVHHSDECLEDLWLDLPESRAAYLSSLGKKTTETFKRAEKKLLREHPTFQMKFLKGDEVQEEQVRAVLQFNLMRMRQKGLGSHHTDDSIAKLMVAVKKYGLVGLAMIEDRICGGVIQLRIGTHWFSYAISHDPAYDDYRLGQLCNFYGVFATIEHGGGIFHFGWGRSEHKYRMGARQTELFKVTLYRNTLALAGDVVGVTTRSYASNRRKLKGWVADREKGSDRTARVIKRLKDVKAQLKASHSRLRRMPATKFD